MRRASEKIIDETVVPELNMEMYHRQVLKTEKELEDFERHACAKGLVNTCLIKRLKSSEEKRYLFEMLGIMAKGRNASAYNVLWNSTHLEAVVKIENVADDTAPATRGIHETAIGLLVANRLRDEGCLNFSKMYGMFRCNNIYHQPNDWCTRDGTAAYLVYEKIYGPTLAKFAREHAPELTLRMILQIVLALKHAQRYSFTHYDLHWDNIIVAELEEPSYNRYIIDGKPFYFYNDGYCPMMIDYGFSYGEVDGKKIALCRPDALIGEGSNPCTDVHKLVFKVALELSSRKPSVTEMLSPITSYFTHIQPLIKYVPSYDKYDGNIPMGSYDFDDLFTWILDSYGLESANIENQKVLLSFDDPELGEVDSLTDYFLREQLGTVPVVDLPALIEKEIQNAELQIGYLEEAEYCDVVADIPCFYTGNKIPSRAQCDYANETLDIYYRLYLSVKLLQRYGSDYSPEFTNFDLDGIIVTIRSYSQNEATKSLQMKATSFEHKRT